MDLCKAFFIMTLFLISSCSEVNQSDYFSSRGINPDLPFLSYDVEEDEGIGDVLAFSGWGMTSLSKIESIKEYGEKHCGPQGRKLVFYKDGDEFEDGKERWVCQTEPDFDTTEAIISTNCYFLSKAPILATDLSDEDKKSGRVKFYKYLGSYDKTYPIGKMYDKYNQIFVQWVVPYFKNKQDGDVLIWYTKNCLS